ncbi:MAG: BMC domain-containing protein [Synergistetes bacterium]|nr:BMC domain-containing protein [Synergistota bacterium]MCX8127765.1 BMC domain-containing protein [Synergistota bacterium]MDW8191319.1 BMC domain-containing protein [Synergistota bacterium]
MSVKAHVILRPTDICLEIIKSRLRPRVDMGLEGCEALLLVQGSVAEIIEIVDIVTKVVNVKAAEIVGNCPQQFNTIVFWGSTADVEQAVVVLKERGKIA